VATCYGPDFREFLKVERLWKVCFIVDSSVVGYDGGQNVRDEERSVAQEQKPRERSFVRALIPDWRPTREYKLRVTRIAILVIFVVLTVLLLLYIIGLLFGVTLWNVLKVMAVPITVGAAVPLLNWLQKKRELELSEQRAEADRKEAEQRAQDAALQAYLDHMSELLADNEQPLHSAQLGDKLSTVARARTLTILSRLDGSRKRSVLEFLYESRLIDQEQVLLDESDLVKRRPNIVSLEQADLSEANLSAASLFQADLRKTNLSEATLSKAILRGADLRYTNLSGADLFRADLQLSNLYRADLSGANLEGAELQGANVSFGELNGANLYGSYLSGIDLSVASLQRANLDSVNAYMADLSGANLRGANLNSSIVLEANLNSADLSGANLREVYLARSTLSGADLRRANLSGADLSGATLVNADMSDADLSNADLSGADIYLATFYRANVRGANLNEVHLQGNRFANEDLERYVEKNYVSLEGATMPNGQKYEEWLKSKDQEENKKSDGSS
jgi:uncharacterized protein YjbI with pentapeptide repeats